MTLDYKTRKIYKDRVIRTILKYRADIDFSPIGKFSSLELRHLLWYIIRLQDDYEERKFFKVKKIK